MNKSKVRQRFVKCNLKQTDICTAFQKWKFIKKEKEMKKKKLCAEVIEIEDSDSESTTINLNNISPKKKRPLAQPFSDDEEQVASPLKQLTLKKENVETSILPKIKRPLKHSFFDEEDTKDIEYSHTGSRNETTPDKQHNLMYPNACSTPIPTSNCITPHTLNSHIGLNNSLNISGIANDRSSTDSETTSETTIIVAQNVSHQRTIKIINDITIPANNNTNPNNVTGNFNCTDNVQSTNKKRCAEQKRNTKKLKTNQSSDGGLNGNLTVNTNEATTQQNKIAKTPPTPPSTCKENKPSHDNNKSTVSSKQGESKTEHTDLHRNEQEASVENTLKPSSKENIQNCSKDEGNKSDGTGSKCINKGKAKAVTNRDDAKTDTSPNQNRVIHNNSETSIGASCSNLNTTSSSPRKSFKAKKEEKKMNKEPVKLIIDLFQSVISSRHVNNLLETERKMITTFLLMDIKYQYTCLKLITRQKKWYNTFKFCKLILLDMEETDICDMVKIFEDNRIIDTCYVNENILHLLQRLDNSDLKCICDKFKLKKTLNTKEERIKKLLKYSTTQSTLTIRKTTKDLLLEEIQRRMGRCMRVSEAFQDAFYSTYALATFTNPTFSKIQDYFASILGKNVIFPGFPIDEYTIFGSRIDFISYVEARKYRDALETCTDHLESLQICKTIFSKLKSLGNKTEDTRFQDVPHLIRFTAKAVYVSSLSLMVESMFSKFPEDVKEWLEYMIKKVDCPHKIGRWYYHLIWLYMRYLKPFNYDRAAKLLIEVLHKKREHLSEIQLHHLRKRGEQLICTVKYKLEQMNHDLIAQLLPKPIRDFPETTIDAKTIRSNDMGRRRDYEITDAEGNKTIYKVEDIALKYYIEELHYTGGAHCEGAFIKATFTLFFFDIIYSAWKSIPGTFVSKIQSEPLDMNSRYFYSNRKEQIDQRLKEIESEWCDTKVIEFLKDNYDKHSHEFAVCEVGVIIKDAKFLEILVECIGRKVLAKIYKRLVENFREYRSGLPDLLVWNVDKKECKFVEVKGENDRLSIGQTLWLDYLRKIGAKIEVCHVHSIGSKRKLKMVDKSVQEASTSGAVP